MTAPGKAAEGGRRPGYTPIRAEPQRGEIEGAIEIKDYLAPLGLFNPIGLPSGAGFASFPWACLSQPVGLNS